MRLKLEHGTGFCFWFRHVFGLLSFIIALATLISLVLPPSNTIFSIQDFHVIPLHNITHNHNHTTNIIYLDLHFRNVMGTKFVYYDNMKLIISYNTSLVATHTVPGFGQWPKQISSYKNGVEMVGVPVANGSTMGFRVQLATSLKFDKLFGYTRSRSVVVGGEVLVDGSGRKVNKKTIKLKRI